MQTHPIYIAFKREESSCRNPACARDRRILALLQRHLDSAPGNLRPQEGKVDNREQQSGSADGPVFPVASLFFCAGFVSLKLSGFGHR